MACRCAVFALLALLALLALGAASARAEDPSAIGAALLYESPRLAVPMVFVVVPRGADVELRLRQTGWNSGVDWTARVEPRLSYVLSADITPLYAHSSNLIYRDGQRDSRLAWTDTSAQLSAGVRLTHDDALTSELRVIALQEWVSQLHDTVQQQLWNEPYVGTELRVVFHLTRSDEPLRARADGVKADLRAQILAGSVPWGRVHAQLSAGRKLGRLFLQAHALAGYVSISNVVARDLFGGGWDVLQGAALYGHPYGELRLQHSIAGNLGADLQLLGTWELGARCAFLGGDHTRATGQALVTSAAVGGVLLSAGVATPNGELFSGNTASLLMFASLSAVTLVP